MTQQVDEERFDHQIRAYLAWQAEDVAGAPTGAEVAARITGRSDPPKLDVHMAPLVAWILLGGLLLVGIIGALAAGAIQPPFAPFLAITDVSPSPHLASIEPDPTPDESLPALPLPGARYNLGVQFGWEGAPRERAEMHRVLDDGNGPRESTILVFAVDDDCLGANREHEARVRVSDFDGVSVENYQPPVTFNDPLGDEITRAYEIAVGRSNLCVYLTWHATTTDEELGSALRTIDALRAQPASIDWIRIVFTLDEGWDTG